MSDKKLYDASNCVSEHMVLRKELYGEDYVGGERTVGTVITDAPVSRSSLRSGDNSNELPTPTNSTFPVDVRNVSFKDLELHIPKKRAGNKWYPASELPPHKSRMERDFSNLPSTMEMDARGSRGNRVTSDYFSEGTASFPADVNGNRARVVSLPGIESEGDQQGSACVTHNNGEPTVLQDATGGSDAAATRNGMAEDKLTGFILPNLNSQLSWRLVKLVGSGNFSDVYLYENTSASSTEEKFQQVAVKVTRYPAELQNPQARTATKYKEMLSRLESSLTRELAVLRSLDYPCIVKLYGINDCSFLESRRPLIDHINEPSLPSCKMIMSYCFGGDVLDVAKRGLLPDWLLQRVFTELAHAVLYLHENLVIHRDLKLENVLLKYPLEQLLSMREDFSCNFIELADFGLCKRIRQNELCTTRCGSEDYISPEVLMGLPYDGRLCDTWALGVILYALLEDRLPFDPLPLQGWRGNRPRSTAHRIARYEWRWLRLINNNHHAKVIVEKCLVTRQHRWSIKDITEADFVRTLAPKLKYLHRH
ncbi:ABL055Cp [Eremothecium gossypii ATCC 10895]|uniref:ABL055Cp n=1 Tax=Eremothecium gossypii (strain ATCC 10895 / CBS 109.51 / FGSC 9923 / NRRL Y-1056) TaxID=284811 RepID=Q75DT1_EREGS|nr:ABL055Cp [Eremothecium gossypii ATCC 10895]AAS50716.1 ABL055Cp [Eremothecium gossypii ATCC 10895]